MANDNISKSWFSVFNNPAEHGYEGTPEEICNRLKEEWIKDSETRCGAWAYCISEKGLHHIHMVLEDTKMMRFSAVKKAYCQGMHFEPTKGSKKEAEDYINKKGKWEEKGEEVVYICYAGEIKGRQGKRNFFDEIHDRIENGETPNDILSDTPVAYKYTSALKQMYYDHRSKNTPIVRDLKVYWHTGKTGTGKSYSRVKLAQEHGEDNIYYLTAFNSGAFDNYNGEPILWIEDYRGEFKLQELLRILDVYKAEIPSRYSNIKALWNEVHITSVLTPQECYSKVNLEDNDRIEQLLRRITAVSYHYIDGSGAYAYYNFSPFETLNSMIYYTEQMKKYTEFIEIFDGKGSNENEQ